MTSRHTFHEAMAAVRLEVDLMGAMAEAAVRGAAAALVGEDRDAAILVIAGDDRIDERFVALEQQVYALMAQQAPVAVDLRLLVSALRVMADWERTGDLAVSVAKLAMDDWERESTTVRLLGRMADIAVGLVGDARRAWTESDLLLAAQLEQRDDVLDACYRRLYLHLLDQHGPDGSGLLLHAALAGRHLERIADHAVAVGDRVSYMLTGDPRSLAAEIR